MPNIERLTKLKEVLLDVETHNAFNMNMYISTDYSESGLESVKNHACGTFACIGGWAVLTFMTPQEFCKAPGGVKENAIKLLELTDTQADWLFHGKFYKGAQIADIVAADACAAIDELIAGKVK